jgi:hypothetical protein
MAKSLLETFSSLDSGLKQSLADISSPRLLAFAALEIAEMECGIAKLSAEHIVACLENAGVAVKALSIKRALAAAAGFTSTTIEEGDVFYRLMTKGKREIEKKLPAGEGKLSVVRIEKDQPRTARLGISEIFSQLTGTVRICDPYYGIRTLDLLDFIPKPTKVRFLTAQANESARQLDGAMKDFKKERPNVEFRTVGKGAGLHDRYAVTDQQIMIFGHGLKDIGGKESFVIRLQKDLTPDLIEETIAAFDAKWNVGTTI